VGFQILLCRLGRVVAHGNGSDLVWCAHGFKIEVVEGAHLAHVRLVHGREFCEPGVEHGRGHLGIGVLVLHPQINQLLNFIWSLD
jgi:hypothetical protein